MSTFDYIERDRKIKEFESEIFSIPLYGEKVKEYYRIDFTGRFNENPVFGFKLGTILPSEIRQDCYDIFHKYFPNCDTSTL